MNVSCARSLRLSRWSGVWLICGDNAGIFDAAVVETFCSLNAVVLVLLFLAPAAAAAHEVLLFSATV